MLARNFLLASLFSFQGASFRPLSRSDRNARTLAQTLRFDLVGGDKRDRTAGLLLARQALSQLSYTPVIESRFLVVGPSGLEPPTSRLSVVRSNQLSYGPSSEQMAAAFTFDQGQMLTRAIAPPLRIKPASLGFDAVFGA